MIDQKDTPVPREPAEAPPRPAPQAPPPAPPSAEHKPERGKSRKRRIMGFRIGYHF